MVIIVIRLVDLCKTEIAHHFINMVNTRAGTNTPSDEYDSYREYRVANTNMYSRIHFFLRGY